MCTATLTVSSTVLEIPLGDHPGSYICRHDHFSIGWPGILPHRLAYLWLVATCLSPSVLGVHGLVWLLLTRTQGTGH